MNESGDKGDKGAKIESGDNIEDLKNEEASPLENILDQQQTTSTVEPVDVVALNEFIESIRKIKDPIMKDKFKEEVEPLRKDIVGPATGETVKGSTESAGDNATETLDMAEEIRKLEAHTLNDHQERNEQETEDYARDRVIEQIRILDGQIVQAESDSTRVPLEEEKYRLVKNFLRVVETKGGVIRDYPEHMSYVETYENHNNPEKTTGETADKVYVRMAAATGPSESEQSEPLEKKATFKEEIEIGIEVGEDILVNVDNGDKTKHPRTHYVMSPDELEDAPSAVGTDNNEGEQTPEVMQGDSVTNVENADKTKRPLTHDVMSLEELDAMISSVGTKNDAGAQREQTPEVSHEKDLPAVEDGNVEPLPDIEKDSGEDQLAASMEDFKNSLRSMPDSPQNKDATQSEQAPEAIQKEELQTTEDEKVETTPALEGDNVPNVEDKKDGSEAEEKAAFEKEIELGIAVGGDTLTNVERASELERAKIEFEENMTLINTAEAFSRFGLTKEDLASVEGFAQLSEGQQRQVAKGLIKMTHERVKNEGLDGYKNQSNKGNVFKRAWHNMSKAYKIRDLEIDSMDSLKEGSLKMHGEVLSALVDNVAKGPGIEIAKDGSLLVEFIPKFENLNSEQTETILKFNRRANELAKTPDEWRTGDDAHREWYEDIKRYYDKAKLEVIELNLEKIGGNEKQAVEFITGIDEAVKMNQFMNTHYLLEKELQDIEDGKIVGEVFKNTMVEKGGYFAMGGIARTVAVGMLGFVAAPTIIATPLIAASLGRLSGRKRAEQHFAENDSLAQRGIEDESNEASSVYDAETLSIRMQRHIQKIESATTEKEKEKFIGYLASRLSFTEDKMKENVIVFGEGAKKVANISELSQAISHARALLYVEENPDVDKTMTSRLNKILTRNQGRVTAKRQRYIAQAGRKGAVWAALFAGAGYAAAELFAPDVETAAQPEQKAGLGAKQGVELLPPTQEPQDVSLESPEKTPDNAPATSNTPVEETEVGKRESKNSVDFLGPTKTEIPDIPEPRIDDAVEPDTSEPTPSPASETYEVQRPDETTQSETVAPQETSQYPAENDTEGWQKWTETRQAELVKGGIHPDVAKLIVGNEAIETQEELFSSTPTPQDTPSVEVPDYGAHSEAAAAEEPATATGTDYEAMGTKTEEAGDAISKSARTVGKLGGDSGIVRDIGDTTSAAGEILTGASDGKMSTKEIDNAANSAGKVVRRFGGDSGKVREVLRGIDGLTDVMDMFGKGKN